MAVKIKLILLINVLIKICLSESPQGICGQNEVYHNCPDFYSPQTCESIGKANNCQLRRSKKMTKLCKGACQCKTGFFRNKIGECISKEDCSKCVGPNEYFSCGVSCDNVCSTLMEMNQTYCPCINVKCNPMCYCESGYARNPNKICVPIPECPKQAPKSECGTIVSTNNINEIITTSEMQKENENGQEMLLEGITAFSTKFVYELVKDNPSVNYITSPFSVTLPLALLALYTTGCSQVQLLAALSAKNNSEIRRNYMDLLKNIKAEDELRLASGLFTDIRFEFNDAFIKDSKNVFDSLSQNLDFRKFLESAEIINSFVESNTNGTIKNIVSPNALTELTRLVLVNTIYFKGDWQNKFNERDTRKRNFYTSYDSSIETDFMYQKVNAKYAECQALDAKVLELPYTGGKFKFNLFLPNKIGSKSLLELISKLFQNPDILRDCLNILNFKSLEIFLPKFKTETSINLTDLLKKLNITSIFEAKSSGINSILKKSQDLYVTDAFQKSFIIINERGSQAASANVIVIGVRSLPLPPKDYIIFDANRPFLYLIRLQNLILFWGTKVQ